MIVAPEGCPWLVPQLCTCRLGTLAIWSRRHADFLQSGRERGELTSADCNWLAWPLAGPNRMGMAVDERHALGLASWN